MRQTIILAVQILWFNTVVQGLNYTGETALLDAAPTNPQRRHATTVTFGELGVFDFSGDGRARVALELGAFSSEKDSKADVPSSYIPPSLVHRELIGAMGVNEPNRPVRDTDPVELDHVYLIFARSRAVNNFVARMYSGAKSTSGSKEQSEMMCTDVGSWLESEFVAPISALRRPPAKKEKSEDEEERQQKDALQNSDDEDPDSTIEEKPKISFISASAPTGAPADFLPRPTKVTGIQRRQNSAESEDSTDIQREQSEEPTTTGVVDNFTSVTNLASVNSTANITAEHPTANVTDKPLLSNDTKAQDVFLVEYEWEWLVPKGGEYAVVIANCAATTIQFKYNLIMANRWNDGRWTNLPAGWMPVQKIYPAVSYSLWGIAALSWTIIQIQQTRSRKGRAAIWVVVGFIPVLRFMGSLADQSRYRLWGASGSYEATMVVVSTSLVDALADAAQFLVLLALAKGWGVVRSKLAGSEKRLLPGMVAFVAVASLYDGATRGGGVLAVAVLQAIAIAYAWASVAHTRRVHAVQTLRLVSRNETALVSWASTQSTGIGPPAALTLLASCSWKKVIQECRASTQLRNQMALLWCAARKGRLLTLVHYCVLPAQVLDAIVLVCSSFAVPPHRAYVGLILTQAAHWITFVALFVALIAGGLDLPDVCLPPLPAIATRRSIPLPPTNAATISPRPMPPLGRLRLLHSSAPFAAARPRATSTS
ncbi:hypothetical protein COEREDRAFT_98283 [Coemansia reversa NRRL 1564]|uniref:Uncharacterized protein n=1 Tax=Coemansia reversa (strain ATCC 12441 / NRRL 1564) TaxID=763665 RepID=A0A2G5B8R4_COERN|nr:hypothetical protein COEREDRAFT_98283 [Coemansia reversa NRRL 1564]|eukprot:PIA15380.1 hypothetical protein COEREDRAFT_98283 [Coemansia reversa NRRL 1564]